MLSLLKKIILPILFLALLTSCSTILGGMMGLKSPQKITDKKIVKFSKKYNIPLSESYKMDSAYYSYLFTLDTISFKEEVHDHYQPLQAMYYENSIFKAYYVNCYVDGFPNLDWNKDGVFNSFPPKTQVPVDSIFTLEQHLKFLQPVTDNSLEVSKYNYIVIVHWNIMMNRQSKRFIKVIQENVELSDNQSIKIMYVNTDSFWIKCKSCGVKLNKL